MAQKLTYKKYRDLVEKQSELILEYLARAAHGELELEIPIEEDSENVDVLTDLAIGFNFLLDDLRTLVAEQKQAQETLEQRVAERTEELENALVEVRAIQKRYLEGQWSEYITGDVIGDPDVPEPWVPVLETAVAQQQTITQTNGHSTLALPVRYADEVIGLMGFSADGEEIQWDEDELAAVESIADQVGLALENQRLFDQTQAALQESSTLYEASARLNAAETFEDILAVLAQYTMLGNQAHHISLDAFNVPWTQTETPEYVRVLARHSDLPESVLRPRYTLAEFSEISKLLHYNKPTIIEDIGDPNLNISDNVRQLYRDGFNGKSTIFIPLAVGTQWIGFVNAIYSEKTPTHENDIQQALALASQAAVALSNRLLLTNTQERATQLETLSQVETALSQANSEEEIIRALMQGLDLSEVSAISLTYLNVQPDDTTKLDMFGFWSNGRFLPDDLITRYRDVNIDDSPLAALWQTQPNAITLIDNITSAPQATQAVLTDAKKNNWQATAIMPLRRGGEALALIWITWQQPHLFSATEKFLFERLLEPISAVVSSRRAQLAQQEALAETASLYRASAEMNAAQSYDEILTVIRKYTVAGRHAISASLNIFNTPWAKHQSPEWIDVLDYYAVNENTPPPTRFMLSDFPSAVDILKADEPTIIEDIDNPPMPLDDNTYHLFRKQFGARAMLFVPLVAGGKWIGYINVLYKENTTFTESDIRRLNSIAGQSAVAIQNISLLEETSQKAQREQMLREITARVRNSADVDTIMKTAVQEIGRALGKKTYIYLESGTQITRKGTSPLTDEHGA